MTRAATALALLLTTTWLVLSSAGPASAHVMPSTAIVLDVRDARIDAEIRIPLQDLEIATDIDLGDQPAAALAGHRSRLRDYLTRHIAASTATGSAWTIRVGALTIGRGEETTSGTYTELTAHAALLPPVGADVRSFRLRYDAVIHRVITHVILVSVRDDWASGHLAGTRAVGTIRVDPVNGTVPVLPVDLGSGSSWQGFTAMVALGVSHIADGTDHQLFLLTLLLPAPLLALGRRWATVVGVRAAVQRITAITLAFTIGHSTTLALGAIGLPTPQQPVEALIALSILVAAVHAVRPLFPGREPLVAAMFGLVHGMAFSATLMELQLSGGQLVLSLLGFNLGIEAMQLVVVALVLPPLVVLARTRAYSPLRIVAAAITGIAAVGWAVDRLGAANPVAAAADLLATASAPVVVALWIPAATVLIRGRRTAAARADGIAPRAERVPAAADR